MLSFFSVIIWDNTVFPFLYYHFPPSSFSSKQYIKILVINEKINYRTEKLARNIVYLSWDKAKKL
jgi:hypothetical protein